MPTMSKSEMAVSKLFSAQWIMAVGVTIGATILTAFVVWKRSEHANVVLTIYFSNWGIIIANYFRRDKTQDAPNVTSTETKTIETKTP